MKKGLFLIFIVIISLFSGCKNESSNEIGIFEIKEKMFVTQCNDIFLNPGDYENKIIKIEGMYNEYEDSKGKIHKYVYRNGPGCCGNDGVVGFEFFYDGNNPKRNDWIEAVGKVEVVKEAGYINIVLNLDKLTVLDVRGAEIVTN